MLLLTASFHWHAVDFLFWFALAVVVELAAFS